MSVLTLPSRRLGGGSPPGRRQHTHRNWNSEPKEFTKKEKQARRPAHGGSKLVEDAVATMGRRRVGDSLLAYSPPPCTPHHCPLVQWAPKSTWAGPQMAHDAPHPPPAQTQILRGNLNLPESGRIRIVPIFDLSHPRGWIQKNLSPKLPPAPLFAIPTTHHPLVRLSGVGYRLHIWQGAQLSSSYCSCRSCRCSCRCSCLCILHSCRSCRLGRGEPTQL